MQHKERLFTDGQLARKLGVRACWLRAEADANRLPHVRVGSGYLFDAEAVEAELLTRARRRAETEPGVPGLDEGRR